MDHTSGFWGPCRIFSSKMRAKAAAITSALRESHASAVLDQTSRRGIRGCLSGAVGGGGGLSRWLELWALLAFLVLYAVGFLGWGMSATRAAVPAGREQELLVLAVKLVVHVGAPALLLALLGAKIAPLFNSGLGRPGFWLPLLVLGAIILALMCVVSPALDEIKALHASIATLLWAAPATFIWLALEAGLCEEFLFRAVLQTRLAAVLKTEAGAVATGAVLFALAHVPGLYLRGHPGVDGYSTDPVQVIAFTIAVLSPVALLFGTLWARTRSLLLIVLLHAAVDVLPNMNDFVRTWTG